MPSRDLCLAWTLQKREKPQQDRHKVPLAFGRQSCPLVCVFPHLQPPRSRPTSLPISVITYLKTPGQYHGTLSLIRFPTLPHSLLLLHDMGCFPRSSCRIGIREPRFGVPRSRHPPRVQQAQRLGLHNSPRGIMTGVVRTVCILYLTFHCFLAVLRVGGILLGAMGSPCSCKERLGWVVRQFGAR